MLRETGLLRMLDLFVHPVGPAHVEGNPRVIDDTFDAVAAKLIGKTENTLPMVQGIVTRTDEHSDRLVGYRRLGVRHYKQKLPRVLLGNKDRSVKTVDSRRSKVGEM